MDPNSNQQPPPDPYPTSPFYNGAAQPSPVISPESDSEDSTPPPNNKLLLMLAIGSALELLVIIGLVVAMAGGGNSKTPAQTTDKNSGSSQNQAAEAATPTGIQAINDSISQDISTLNDERDFAPAKYEDKALAL